jgi:phage-related protein
MPKARVVFFCDANGEAPVVDWLRKLLKSVPKAWAQCRVRIEQLEELGHELRRPAADFLCDGIYELRAKRGHVQYRILYFFHGRNVAILAHSITKEQAVPPVEIERALKRKRLFESKPKEHTYEENEE